MPHARDILLKIESVAAKTHGFALTLFFKDISLFSIIEAIDVYPFIYWCSKNNSKEFLFLGVDKTFQTMGQLQIDLENNQASAPYFAAPFFFDQPCHPSIWSNFWPLRFIKAAIVFEKMDSGIKVTINRAMNFNLKELKIHPWPTPQDETVLPYEQWEEMINKALGKIQDGVIQKVALSQRKSFRSQGHYHPHHLISEIQKRDSNEYKVLWALNESEFFVSFSPEGLFTINDKMIQVDSLAGTIERSHDPFIDDQLALKLLNSTKNIEEHRFVTHMILNTLVSFCDTVEMTSKEKILKLSHVQHIYSQIQGQLCPDFNLEALIKALHPTPAVGGVPKLQATTLIQELESYERGPYAAPLGPVSKDYVEFCVGIRSALFQKNEAHVFGGVGVVEQSTPQEEWCESLAKMKNFTDMLCRN